MSLCGVVLGDGVACISMHISMNFYLQGYHPVMQCDTNIGRLCHSGWDLTVT